MSFDAEKATHMAAYFLLKEDTLSMPHLKLIKLLYFSERESLRQYGWPMCGDRMFSMPHGPVLSASLDLINRNSMGPNAEIWNELISDRKGGHEISLNHQTNVDELDALSVADIKILEKISKELGKMDKYDLRDYSHIPENCPEWENPGTSSKTIHLKDFFKAINYSEDDAEKITQQIEEQEHLNDFLENL